MASYNKEWEELGENIAGIIDRAVESHDFKKMENAIRDTVDRAAARGAQTLNNAVNQVAARRLYGSTIGKYCKSFLQLICGVPFLITAFGMLMGGQVDGVTITRFFGWVIFFLAMLMGGIWLTCLGIRNMGMLSRFKIYKKIMGDKTYCKLELLAKGVGKKVGFVRKELYRMIGCGLFREGHLDKEETCLIVSEETYQYYESSRMELEQRQKQAAEAPVQTDDPKVRQIVEQGEQFLAQLRKCNDDIPGVEISEKISRIELLVQKIYQRAQEDPEVIPELKRLQGYYLPMTIKLLEAYADMDAQPIQGQTIMASKQEIEATLDTLNTAFEKLLDSIFKETSLDISSDIFALNVLLAQEGLTEDELSKMKSKGETA